jgi:hypothetical protein
VSERVRRYLAGDGIEVERDGLRVVHGVAQGPEGSPAEDIVTLHDVDGVPFAVAGAEQLHRALRPTREATGRVRVGSEREGWRARLANVERNLVTARAGVGKFQTEEAWRAFHDALAEVRSMIDGDETTGAA